MSSPPDGGVWLLVSYSSAEMEDKAVLDGKKSSRFL